MCVCVCVCDGPAGRPKPGHAINYFLRNLPRFLDAACDSSDSLATSLDLVFFIFAEARFDLAAGLCCSLACSKLSITFFALLRCSIGSQGFS